MPGYFSLALQFALQRIQSQLRRDEKLFAYLDDIYLVSTPNRTRAIFDLVRVALQEEVGIDVNLGKCKCWNAAGNESINMSTLGSDVWVGAGSDQSESQGIVI